VLATRPNSRASPSTTSHTGAPLSDISVLRGGLDAARLTFAVPPIVAELETTDFGAASPRHLVTRRVGVQVVVRGRIGTTPDTGNVTLPAVPLELPIVLIPAPLGCGPPP
jgi:hypothetical protein